MISTLHVPPPRKQALFHSCNKLVIFPCDDWLRLALSQSAGSIKSGFIIRLSPRCQRTSEALLTSLRRAVLKPTNWTRTKSGCFVWESLYANPSLMQLRAVIARLFHMRIIWSPVGLLALGHLVLRVGCMQSYSIYHFYARPHTFEEIYRNVVLFYKRKYLNMLFF